MTVTSNPASRVGGSLRSRAITASASSVRDGDRRRDVYAVAAGQVVEQVRDAAAGGLRHGRQIAAQHRGADAVLVAHRLRVDAVADRLLVRVDEVAVLAARASHLKPVNVSTCRAPRAAAIAASIRDDTTVLATTAPGSVCRKM